MGKIYIYCPDYNEPSGGIRKLYHYADHLNSWGFDASILHDQPGFRCTWFMHDTKITCLEEVTFATEDIVALPEVNSHLVFEFPKGIRKIIINQNAYNTFGGFLRYNCGDPYLHEDVIAVLVHSQHDLEYIRYLYPDANVYRMYCGIDNQIFRFNPDKLAQVAYMPRKYDAGAQQLMNLLNHRDILHGFRVRKIENTSLEECARIMQESLIFLSFSSYEGFGLPPIEALSCGCIVIGFHGNGGKEYFKPEFSFPVEYGDLLNFVLTIRRVITTYRQDPGALAAKAKSASEFVLANYSPAIEKATELNFWKSILDHRIN